MPPPIRLKSSHPQRLTNNVTLSVLNVRGGYFKALGGTYTSGSEIEKYNKKKKQQWTDEGEKTTKSPNEPTKNNVTHPG